MSTLTPIVYQMDYKPEELTTVTFRQNLQDNNQLRRTVPVASAKSIESVLHVMVEFDEAAIDLIFDAEDLYTNFRLILPAVTT